MACLAAMAKDNIIALIVDLRFDEKLFEEKTGATHNGDQD